MPTVRDGVRFWGAGENRKSSTESQTDAIDPKQTS